VDYRKTTWTNFHGRGRTFNGEYGKRQKSWHQFPEQISRSENCLVRLRCWKSISISEQYDANGNGANLRLREYKISYDTI